MKHLALDYRFKLKEGIKQELLQTPFEWGFGLFSQVVFYRTYSRKKDDGTQENIQEATIRILEGVMSIRKDYYLKHSLTWDDETYQKLALKMGMAMLKKQWSPPGRGMWAMGSPFIYERGSAALFNCAYVRLDKADGTDFEWMMDMLMCGVGVGFSPDDNIFKLDQAVKTNLPPTLDKFIIPDTREGWSESVKHLVNKLFQQQEVNPDSFFDYSLIRPEGSPIKTFGGTASGPGPLIKLHKQICQYFAHWRKGVSPNNTAYNLTSLRTDIANAIGCCVVAGNVRRSAQIALSSVNNTEFLDLKNFERTPYRADIGWMSNNSATLDNTADFLKLPEIAARVLKNGEPGYLNRMNIKYGRVGKLDEKEKYGIIEDLAEGVNPCGEIPLENYETCNLAETYPSNCDTEEDWYQALYFATFYATTVNLLPTHLSDTNKVVAKNRRIGVSMSGFAQWKAKIPLSRLTHALRHGYKVVRQTNDYWSADAGVPRAVRVTTVKPSGSISKVFGVTSGAHHPPFAKVIRRINFDDKSELKNELIKLGVPHEPSAYSDNTTVLEFPVDYGNVKPAQEVSIWEQANNLMLLQREWADNAVSVTIYFSKQEEKEVESVLSMIAPHTKSASLLPHTEQGVYKQMPEEYCSDEEYEKRKAAIIAKDLSSNEEAKNDDVYCAGGACTFNPEQK